MKVSINHRTVYSYDAPVRYALQRLRLVPTSGRLQTVVEWSLEVEGADREVSFVDAFGNTSWLVSAHGEPHEIVITASGEVETIDRAGVQGSHVGHAPLWLFQRPTPLTLAGERTASIVEAASGADALTVLHAVNEALADAIVWEPGSTEVHMSGEEALQLGRGVCQDHAHAFIAAARSLGHPARYVSGYLLRDDAVEQAASHAWAEAHVDGLGWVGFDPANRQSPDGRYVRLAVGRDYRDAMPISGIVLGATRETLAVTLTVEQ